MITDRELDALLRGVLADEAAAVEGNAPPLQHAVAALIPRVQSRAGGTKPLVLVLAAACLLVALVVSAVAVGAWLKNTLDEHPPRTYSDEFRAVGQLPAEAAPQAIVALPDGSALVVGKKALFRFDPATAQFTQVASLLMARDLPAALLLQDGRVLIVGGGPFQPGGYPAEIYDPGSQTSTLTGPPINFCGCTATLLDDGRVLVFGGNEPELFDPATGEFTEIGVCLPCQNHEATFLDDGRTLVMGSDTSGEPAASAVLYDSVTGTSLPAGPVAVPQVSGFTATRLTDGRVLLVGGWDANGNPVGAAQVYDPSNDRFTETGSLPAPRAQQSAALLRDGRVLLVGGWNGNTNAMADGDDAFIYDPSTGAFTSTASLTIQRLNPLVATLADGRILVVGSSCHVGAGNCGLNDVGIGADRELSAEVFE